MQDRSGRALVATCRTVGFAEQLRLAEVLCLANPARGGAICM